MPFAVTRMQWKTVFVKTVRFEPGICAKNFVLDIFHCALAINYHEMHGRQSGEALTQTHEPGIQVREKTLTHIGIKNEMRYIHAIFNSTQ